MSTVPHTIPADERHELDTIGPGMPRDIFMGSELLRRWSIVWDHAGEMWLRHAQGAMLQLRWSGGEIVALREFEGAAAAAQERTWAWRFDPALRQRLLAALTPGVVAEQALEAVFGRRHVRLQSLDVALRADGGQARLYRAGGLLQLQVARDGRVVSAELLEEGAAADRAAQVPEADFAAPEPAGLRAARTWGEALLFVRSLGGAPARARIENGWDPVRYVILATTAEGLRRFSFTVEDPTAPDPHQLGAGTSSLLDAADLLLAASAAERAGDTQLAAAAIEQALRFVPAGADSVPAASLGTHTARRMQEQQPQRFTRASLESERARLGGAR